MLPSMVQGKFLEQLREILGDHTAKDIYCIYTSCAVPESFLRGGPTLMFLWVFFVFFLLMKGGWI